MLVQMRNIKAVKIRELFRVDNYVTFDYYIGEDSDAPPITILMDAITFKIISGEIGDDYYSKKVMDYITGKLTKKEPLPEKVLMWCHDEERNDGSDD